MKKFISLLVAAVLMTTLVMPVTASATTSTYVTLCVTDGVKVNSIPSGWELQGEGDEGVWYITSDEIVGAQAASVVFNQWTADNFDIPTDMIFLGFTDDVTGKTLDQCSSTSTNFCTIISKLDVTAPGIVEGENVDDYPLSFTSTPDGASTGYDLYWFKAPVGEKPEESGLLVEEGETFDKAYDYYISITFEANGGYAFTDNTNCFVNGTKVEFDHKYDSLHCISKVNFKSDEPTTVAPTTTTTAAATSPQTGDAASLLFYVLTIIALAGAASVTIFARRKK